MVKISKRKFEQLHYCNVDEGVLKRVNHIKDLT